MTNEDDVATLVAVAASLGPGSAATYGTAEFAHASGIADHLDMLAATHPEWFAPYRDLALTTLRGALQLSYSAAVVLLPGASRSAVDAITQLAADDPRHLNLLAATRDPAGLESFAGIVRENGWHKLANCLGVHVGATGPGVWRFGAATASVDVPAGTDGTVGLPLADVADDPAGLVTWHYGSFRAAALPALPSWPHDLVHLVSPRAYWWALQAGADDRGRLTGVEVVDEEPFTTGLEDAEADPPAPHGLTIRPLGADHIYCNGHVHLTPGVVGVAGGPPIGIYPNPVCSGCGVLMFHVASCTSALRPYAEGFVSVFVCETCVRTGATGTNWN